MQEKIFLDDLSVNSVSIRKQEIIIGQNGKEYFIGDIWRRAYINSIQGRNQVKDEIQEPYQSVILLMWGDTPTVIVEGMFH